MSHYSLREIVHDEALDRAFVTTFSSSQQKAVIDLTKSYGQRLENGTMRDWQEMDIFEMCRLKATDEVKRR